MKVKKEKLIIEKAEKLKKKTEKQDQKLKKIFDVDGDVEVEEHIIKKPKVKKFIYREESDSEEEIIVKRPPNKIYAIAGVSVLVLGYLGYKLYTNSKTDTTSVTPTPTSFNITNFLNGNWTWDAYELPSDPTATGRQIEHDEMTIKGNDIFWLAKSKTIPEFTITSKKYDDATGKLLMSYKRNSKDESWDDILTINKTAKTLTGTQNDGTIKVVLTKHN